MKREKTEISLSKIMRKVMPLVWECCPQYYVTTNLVAVAHGVSWAVGITTTQVLFDTVTSLASGETTYLYAILALGLFLGVLLAQQVLNGVGNYMYNILFTRIHGYLARKVGEKSARLDLIRFEDPSVLDDINKASKGAQEGFFAANMPVFVATFYVPYFIYTAWYLFRLQPILILAVLFAFIPKFVSLLVKAPIYAKLEGESAPIRREYDFYEQAISDRVYFKETRLLGAFGFFKELYRDAIRLLNKKTWKADARTATVDLSMTLLSLASYFGILYLLFHSLITGDITVGAFAAVFSNIGLLISIMDEVVCRHLGEMGKNLGPVRNFIRFLEMDEREGSLETVDWSGDIAISHADFRYPGAEKDCLHDINLTVRSGETIAIVGENGAGKTTIVKLLTGLYRPTSGTVTVSGTDISRVAPKALYEGVSGVFQKYQRYQLTLRENIEISQMGAENGLDEAANKAGIERESPQFPDGYDTMLSREFDGVDLSGGQWQRVAIGRGFYRTHDMIVLDEPTAAIDPIEESNIYRKFAELSEGKTAVIVTHRLGSARIADRIIVMDAGRIVEEGTHEALLAAGLLYAKMYQAQAEWYTA